MRLTICECRVVRSPDGSIIAIWIDGLLVARRIPEFVRCDIESAIARGETEVEVKDGE